MYDIFDTSNCNRQSLRQILDFLSDEGISYDYDGTTDRLEFDISELSEKSQRIIVRELGEPVNENRKIMKKTTQSKLRSLIERIIREEEGRTYAKPVVKKGEKVKVYSFYDRRWYKLTAHMNSEFNDELETYGFLASETTIGAKDFGDYGIYVTWEEEYWVVDPAYNNI